MKDTLGARISLLLANKNLTQKEFAKLTGLNEVTVGRYINNKREPTASVLKIMADTLNVSVDYLLGKSSTRELTQEEENDVYKKFEDLKNSLENTDDLMFCGEILDDETRELLLSSLKNTILTSKIIAKEREKNK